LQYDILGYSFGSIRLSADYLPMPRGTEVDLKACSAATGYISGLGTNPTSDDLETDACIQLASGRFAKIKLVQVSESTLTFDITVWEKE
jgi:hypothetical protein